MDTTQSIYVAHWDGLLGVLTQGNTEAEVTWTEDSLVDAFYEMGTFVTRDMRTRPKFIKDLMKADCTVFDITDSGVVSNWLPYNQFANILGATGWTHDYLESNISPFSNWTRMIRSTSRPEQWTDEGVRQLKTLLLSQDAKSMTSVFDNNINHFIQKVHLDSLVWAMQTMTSDQKCMMSECIELALISNLEYEMFPGDVNFKILKQGTEMHEMCESVKDLPWDRDVVISAFNVLVMVQTFAVCEMKCKTTNNCMIRLEYRLSMLQDEHKVFDLDLTIKDNMRLLHDKYRSNYIRWATDEDCLITVPAMEEWLALHMKLYYRLYYSIDRNKFVPVLDDFTGAESR